jgi:hypothetical protein
MTEQPLTRRVESLEKQRREELPQIKQWVSRVDNNQARIAELSAKLEVLATMVETPLPLESPVMLRIATALEELAAHVALTVGREDNGTYYQRVRN